MARSFLAAGDSQRGVALLSRAMMISETLEAPLPSVRIELAIALAEHADDLPTAIHHVRSVPFGVRETIAARALEGRWRHRLDDIVGASNAFAEAREAAVQLPISTVAEERGWLIEAALFELDVRKDARTAKRHAEIALRACPNDQHILQVFRRAARAENKTADDAKIADPIVPIRPMHHERRGEASATCESDAQSTVASEGLVASDAFDDMTVGGADVSEAREAAADDARIEVLTDRVRANPCDQDAVGELCDLLERAHRPMDLMALLSASLEETTDLAFRSVLLSTRRRVLCELIRVCRQEGRFDESEMYEMVLSDGDNGELDT